MHSRNTALMPRAGPTQGRTGSDRAPPAGASERGTLPRSSSLRVDSGRIYPSKMSASSKVRAECPPCRMTEATHASNSC